MNPQYIESLRRYVEQGCTLCVDKLKAAERDTYAMGPSHEGSQRCESGSLASGGEISHCTCDICF